MSLPKNYSLRRSCCSCRHAFRYQAWDDWPAFYCRLGMPEVDADTSAVAAWMMEHPEQEVMPHGKCGEYLPGEDLYQK